MVFPFPEKFSTPYFSSSCGSFKILEAFSEVVSKVEHSRLSAKSFHFNYFASESNVTMLFIFVLFILYKYNFE